MASKAACTSFPLFKPLLAQSNPLPITRLPLNPYTPLNPNLHLQRPINGYSLSPTPLRCSTADSAAESDSPSRDSLWSRWKANTATARGKMAELGLAAVLAYGLFDGVTYTTFFTLAFLGYEKSTGNNPAANLKALLGIVILMWTGNNVTRPFRVAGAAALAPAIDKLLKKIQAKLKLSKQIYAFALVVALVGGSCLSFIGLLILSRWGK